MRRVLVHQRLEFLGADQELRILDPAAFACQAMMRPPWPYPISFGFFSSGVMGPKGAAFGQITQQI
jgi:hypothetical protein